MSLSLSSIPLEVLWAIIGIMLVIFEFLIPGLVLAFFGIGALITALTTWIGITPTLAPQLMVFIISSILLLVFLRKFMKKTFLGGSKETGTGRNVNVEMGKIVPVIEYIQPGEVGGKVRYQGSNWLARATEPVAPGESVRITGSDNLTLIVEKINQRDEEEENE
ncbi:MAG: NfeD family protein [bacterium]|nr:NfeD family protein [bacterium]